MYAAVNLKQNLFSMYCSIEANERHEASRGLFATAELLVSYLTCIRQIAKMRFFSNTKQFGAMVSIYDL